MAFSIFKKNKKDPVSAPRKQEKKSSLVPVTEPEIKKDDKKVPVVQQKNWQRFPIGSDSILMHPIMTEKAMKLSTGGKYVFEVSRSTSKIQIRKAFFNTYGIMPTKIAVLRQEGKEVRHGRQIGRRRAVKKAIITVPKGKQVDIGI